MVKQICTPCKHEREHQACSPLSDPKQENGFSLYNSHPEAVCYAKQCCTAQGVEVCLLPLHTQGSPLEGHVPLFWTARDCSSIPKWKKNLLVYVVCKCLCKMLNSHYNVAKPVTFFKANTAYTHINRQAVTDLCYITIPSTFSLFKIFLSD